MTNSFDRSPRRKGPERQRTGGGSPRGGLEDAVFRQALGGAPITESRNHDMLIC